MRCKNCPALTGTGEDQYCCLGVEDDELLEDQKGDLGCNRRSKAKILRDIDIAYKDEYKLYKEEEEEK